MSINSTQLANQIISFIFSRAIYDAFNDIAMVTANCVSLTVEYNCTFVSASGSHNYSDIGTIESVGVHAILDAKQTINSDELTALMRFQRHLMNPRRQLQRTRDIRFVVRTSSPRYLRKSVFKNQFLLDDCSD